MKWRFGMAVPYHSKQNSVITATALLLLQVVACSGNGAGPSCSAYDKAGGDPKIVFLAAPGMAASAVPCSKVSEVRDYGIFVDLSYAAQDTCYGSAECGRRIWCYQGPRRHLDFSKVFHDVTIEVEFPGASTTCVLVQSEDTYLRLSWLNSSKNGVIERLQRQQAKGYNVQRQMTSTMDSSLRLFGSCSGSTCRKVVSPYQLSCVALCGQSVKGELKVSVVYSNGLKLWYVSLFALGLVIFHSAPYLSDQVVFYYMSGVSLGVLLSVLLIVFYIFKRTMPKRSSWFSFALAALAQSVFGLLTVVRGWWEQLIMEHLEAVLMYIVVAAAVSLALTHWLLKGPRGVEVGAGLRDIVRAGIRLVGSFFIYMSTRSLFWSFCFLLLLLAFALFRGPLKTAREQLQEKLFPDRGIAVMTENYLGNHQFLSPSEFEVQGKIETERHMKNLLKTPQFQQWAIRNADRLTVKPREHED